MDEVSSNQGQINHVSDTALMVAACRALETELPDAFARDPFAARLTGERGFAILNAVPYSMILRFGMAIRTRFLDELLTGVLGCDAITTVLSVGCGLDTRPWRLDIPAELRWIEVDFSDVLDYKYRLLANEKAHCNVERLSVDLNDPVQRQTMYDKAGSRALMITEGVLMYLPAGTVKAMAAEAREKSGVAHWISDITTDSFNKALAGGRGRDHLEHVRAPDALSGEQILDVLSTHAWITAEMRSYIRDTAFTQERVRRMFGDRPAAPPAFAEGDPTGVHRFERG
jgi:methyltransferase (TIGR00027 family)